MTDVGNARSTRAEGSVAVRQSLFLSCMPPSTTWNTQAAEELLEIAMRQYEGASTLMTSTALSNNCGMLLADVAVVAAI
jgi:hypothetical protein